MDALLVPRSVSSSHADIWLGTSDTAGLQLNKSDGQVVPLPAWKEWPSDASSPVLRYGTVRIVGLAPDTTVQLVLSQHGRQVDTATMITLPAQLPLEAAAPFIVMLGSCFAQREDDNGRLAQTYRKLPTEARPNVKILAGDQVYLDDPQTDFTFDILKLNELRTRFFHEYIKTWQLTVTDALRDLLKVGANYLICDDHEFWNNAPNVSPLILNSYLEHNRVPWWNTARELYQVFQNPLSYDRFDVPPVSFFVIDTRSSRSADRTSLMVGADLEAMKRWVKALQGPGFLVIGQPIMQERTGYFKGKLADWNLPDFEQYKDIVGALMESAHDLVVLTGDVHFGRIAYCALPSGRSLIEIISSPMSLVSPLAGGSWSAAPPRFPAEVTGSDLKPRPSITTEQSFQATEAHFMTLELTRLGAGAKLVVRYWPVIYQRGANPPPGFGRRIWTRILN